MNNIFVLNKNYKKIGTLSNQGANPQAPYFNDLYTQELETGADTYQFSTLSNKYTQDCLEIGNHIMFAYKNRNELFTITSIEYSHSDGYKTIGVYAESVGFELLDVYMERPKTKSSRSGNDSDGDGDDNTDDEYADPDDVYIDADGNIIYDKNGGNKPSAEDVTIDGDGNIIYKPSKSKKNDSLEFKNISYPTFLKLLLKNTGWYYVCQPGLESVKHDITVSYDRNIYAILQDSMQSYRGVELEFVYEYNNGKVQKTVKAYKDGGRGSFVGKRFEYGVNVKGITKTQEVADSEDDTILYVDNIGIDVYYDVDFALKSAEVPEIEIGDTHYVIDNDFCPPMQIKARIGKIEVSFSDPTRNKIYLANNKKIRGSAIEDEFGADDVNDMLDDYDFDSGEYVPYHKHDSLYDFNSDSYSVMISGRVFHGTTSNYFNLGSSTFPWGFAFTNNIRNSDEVTSPRYFGYNYQVYYDRDDMEDVTKITDSSNVTKQDLLNFIMNDLNVYEYSATEVNEAVNKDVDDPEAYFAKQQYFGILSEDVVTGGNPCKTSKVGKRIGKGTVQGDTNNDGDQNNDDTHNTHTYNIPALLAALIGAFQQHVITGGGATTTGPSNKDEDYGYDGGNGSGSGDSGDSGSGDSGNSGSGGITSKIICEELEISGADGSAGIAKIFGELYVTEKIKCELTTETNTLEVNKIVFSDGSTMITAGTGSGNTPGSGNYATVEYVDSQVGAVLELEPAIRDLIELEPAIRDLIENGSGDSGGGSTPSTGNVFDTITVTKIQGPDPGEGQYNRVQFEDGIRVNHIWSADDDGVIHMQDDLALHNSFEVFGDISTDGKIYVNEGIQFADGSVLTSAYGASTVSDLSEYATVEALQEEIRIKDEQIANLEARLATIEAMLGINNDN